MKKRGTMARKAAVLFLGGCLLQFGSCAMLGGPLISSLLGILVLPSLLGSLTVAP